MEQFRKDLKKRISEVYEGEEKVLVFGEGPENAPLMLIGEAPGEQEALLGRPFAGRAGKNLDAFLEATGLEREKMYVTNTVKFRPSRVSAAGRVVNRPPTREEIALFLPFLLREIRLVKPRLIVTLGNVPLKALAGKEQSVGDVHGTLLEAEGFPLFPMYHPASLIYNPSLRPVYLEDMRKLAELTKNNSKFN